MNKLAIIGASTGQLPLVRKARQKGIETHCYAWADGAVCRNECDFFHDISIYDIDAIVESCQRVGVDGVVSTASEKIAPVVAQVAQRLGLNGTTPQAINTIQNKGSVRRLTASLSAIAKPRIWTPSERDNIIYPCVVKPAVGAAKKGVSFCASESHLDEALKYAGDGEILIEEYITGDEYSVESLSYHGEHHVIQVTQKKSSGHPHFVELEHHQPAPLSDETRQAVEKAVCDLLTAVGYTNGASHIELKINPQGIYLIEINARGGGGHIADTLVHLSTDCDYISDIIDISLDRYVYNPVHNIAYSGILFLSAQNTRVQQYFNNESYPWLVERCRLNNNDTLTMSTSNYDRDGYIIYQSQTPIEL